MNLKDSAKCAFFKAYQDRLISLKERHYSYERRSPVSNTDKKSKDNFPQKENLLELLGESFSGPSKVNLSHEENRPHFIFLECPITMSDSHWDKLARRLKEILERKDLIPLLCSPQLSEREKWQRALDASYWPFDSAEAKIEIKNKTKEPSPLLKKLKEELHNRTLSDGESFIGFFSSGSTGTPKLILHRTSSLLQATYTSGKILNLKEQDFCFSTLPCFHMGGFLTGLRSFAFKLRQHWCPSYELNQKLEGFYEEHSHQES